MSKPQPKVNDGTFKEPEKPAEEKPLTNEQIIDSQQKRIEQLLKMVDRDRTIIEQMANRIQENGIQYIVLARNALGILNKPIDPNVEIINQ